MKDFTKIWKDFANRKAITCRDVIQHCILRAMVSKGDTEAVLKHLLHKAFSPKQFVSNPYEAIARTNARIDNYRPKLLGVDCELILDSDANEINEFNEFADALYRNSARLIRYYSYFFTRQDISPEQQLVQTAHAALELGNTLKPEQVKDLHFTCIGVRDLAELMQVQDVLDHFGHQYIIFREPDIGNQPTAIAVEPIAENKRGVLRNYPLLTFKEEECPSETMEMTIPALAG